MSALLPVGTVVRVTERGEHARPPYVGKVVGYDIFRTKYELGFRYMTRPTRFSDGGRWAFPGEVEPCEEDA